ncbi:MAG: hypothetical protein HQL32_11830 [Planctomycetes bacterium]|nr:hypothetical protein [Planctomycetota bacterium]
MQDINRIASGSYIEFVCQEFAENIDEQVAELHSNCKGAPVSPSYFNGKGGKNGFLGDLLECLNDQGLGAISRGMNPKLQDDSTLPIKDFLIGMSTLSITQLKNLSQFYMKMGGDKMNEDRFPPECQKIAGYFSSHSKATNDSAEAGRLILILSDFARAVVKIKKTIEDYLPKTTGYIDFVCARMQQDNVKSTALTITDQVRKAVDFLVGHFKDYSFPLSEIKKILVRLKRQKRELLKVIIEKSGDFMSNSNQQIVSAGRMIWTWMDWEVLCQSDSTANDAIKDDVFAKKLSQFKMNLTLNLTVLNMLTNELIANVFAKQRISPYFFSIVSEAEERVSQALSSKIYIDPNIRMTLKKLIINIKNLKGPLMKGLERDQKEFASLPDIIRKRIQYFSIEIPKVLCRGDAKEVKYMTIAVNHSYKNIEASLRRSISDQVEQTKIESLCNLIKKRYTEVVTHATRMIKLDLSLV